MSIAILTAASLAMSLSAATSPNIAQPDAETAATTEKSEEICKTILITGTRFKERICRPAKEWVKQKDNHRDLVDRLKSTGRDFDMANPGQPPQPVRGASQVIAPNGGTPD